MINRIKNISELIAITLPVTTSRLVVSAILVLLLKLNTSIIIPVSMYKLNHANLNDILILNVFLNIKTRYSLNSVTGYHLGCAS